MICAVIEVGHIFPDYFVEVYAELFYFADMGEDLDIFLGFLGWVGVIAWLLVRCFGCKLLGHWAS